MNLSEADIEIDVLCEVLSVFLDSRHLQDGVGHGPLVGVAGSCALYKYMKRETGMEAKWRPSSMDVYVTGSLSRTIEQFKAFVNSFLSKVRRNKLYASVRRKRWDAMLVRGERLLVIDVDFCDMKTKLCFVQFPVVVGIENVCDYFDLNVMKVWYGIQDCGVRLERQVRKDVEGGILKWCGSRYEDAVADRWDSTRLECIGYRVKKYKKRGFQFAGYPVCFWSYVDMVCNDIYTKGCKRVKKL